ncbi:DUF2974 domain-containing protein [Haemophilus haemoglobinophilus]|nr:DUF2974 domain-containing protein [Canicola haemoglobinophilus]
MSLDTKAKSKYNFQKGINALDIETGNEYLEVENNTSSSYFRDVTLNPFISTSNSMFSFDFFSAGAKSSIGTMKISTTEKESILAKEITKNTELNNSNHNKSFLELENRSSTRLEKEIREEKSQFEENLPTSEKIQATPLFISKIHYKGESLITKSTSPFNFQDLRYEERVEISTPKKSIFYLNKESANYSTYLSKLNDYVYNHDSEFNNKVINAYKTDTDNDGLIDIHDKNPTTWDVSNRDLRMFSSLAYSKTDQIDKIFNEKDRSMMSHIDVDKFGNNTSVEELVNNWKLLHRSLDQAGTGGLDYAVFGNGDNGDGTYKNVVVAFRGTNGDAGDLASNASIPFGGVPNQANNLAPIREIVKHYASGKIYTTGHSLGGYLAQYFASNYLQRDDSLRDKFARSAVFNTAILKTIFWSHRDLKAARKLTDEFLVTKYEEADTAKDWMLLNKTNSYVIKGEFVHMTAGLGGYNNTTWIDGKTFNSLNRFTKHKMVNFYSEDDKLNYFFDYGYRMDNHYLNKDTDGDGIYDAEERRIGTDPNNADSDNDGFSDKIEIALESDALKEDSTPNIMGKIIDKGTSVSVEDKPFVSIVSIEEKGKETAHYAVAMQGVKEGEKIVYAPVDPNNPILLENVSSISDEQGRSTSVIFGTSDADQIYIKGNSYLTGKEGEDTFIFKTSAFNTNSKPSHITDFMVGEDKIDLSNLRTAFAPASSKSSWDELFTTNNANLESGKDYVIFNSNEHSLSYKIANADPVVLAYFDNNAVLAANSLIG